MTQLEFLRSQAAALPEQRGERNHLQREVLRAARFGLQKREKPGLAMPMIGQDDLRRIVAWQARNVATRVTTRAAEVESGKVRAIIARPWKRPVVTDLPSRESSH